MIGIMFVLVILIISILSYRTGYSKGFWRAFEFQEQQKNKIIDSFIDSYKIHREVDERRDKLSEKPI